MADGRHHRHHRGAAGSFNPGPTWHIKARATSTAIARPTSSGSATTAPPRCGRWRDQCHVRRRRRPVQSGAPWHIKATGDFNGDGKSDIIWQGDNGTAAMWLMDGTNATLSVPRPVNPGSTWHIKGTGDFNGDGKTDIIWQGKNGTAAIWLMNGTNDVCRCRRLQSGTELGDQGHRRLQRRRQDRHPVARPGRHAGDLVDGRHQCHV